MNETDKELLETLLRDLNEARAIKVDLPLANKLMIEAESRLKTYPLSESLRYWSWFSYEKAFVLNVEGKPEEAAKWFKKSGTYAKQDNDMLRSIIGNFRYTLTLYLAGKLSSKEAYTQFLEIKKENDAIEIPTGGKSRHKSSSFNILKRVSELAFETSAPKFEHWAHSILDHEFMMKSAVDHDPMYELLRAQTRARLEMLKNQDEAASGILATYLDVDIPELTLDPKVKDPQGIRTFAHEKAEEIARDYRDLGRALTRSSALANREELATSVWQRGSNIPKNRGNHRFLEEIKEDLETLLVPTP